MKNLTKLLTLVIAQLVFINATLFATSYTWNGGTSTAWGTGSNWTPNGVPGSGDNVTIVTTSNQPVYDGVAGVSNFTMTSGTLNLGTHTLDISGDAVFNGGTINNGELNATGGSATFAGTTFGCIVTADCDDVIMNGSVFNNTTTLTKTGGYDDLGTGGNVFNDTLVVNQNGEGVFAFGTDVLPDTFNEATYFTCSGNFMVAGYSSEGNYFGGDLYLNITNSNGIALSYMGSSTFAGNIYITNSSDGVIIIGEEGGSSTLVSGKTILEGAEGFSGGFVAIMNLTKYGSTPINLDLESAGIGFKSCSINGGVTFTGGTYYLDQITFNHAVSFTQNSGDDMYQYGGNTFNGNATFGNNTAYDIYLANTAGDDFNGNVTYIQSSTGHIRAGYNGTSTYAGNITANGGGNLWFGLGSSVCRSVLDGSGVQTLSGSTTEISFMKLKISNTGGYINAENIVTIEDSLVFDNGILQMKGDYLLIHDDCKTPGASDSSYAEGQINKLGDDAYTYPVGRNGHYRPIGMSAPSSTDEIFYANYFNKTSNDDYSHSSKDGGIAELSRSEYWILQRYEGSTDVSVTLSWDTLTTSCSFASAANLKVCSWNGSQWKDRGNGGTTGNLVKGTVVSSGTSSTYGAYALGTSSTFYCVPCYADAGVDIRLLSGYSGQIGMELFESEDYRYSWNPTTGLNSDEEANPVISLTNFEDEISSSIYKLSVESPDGCVATDDVEVLVIPSHPFPIDSMMTSLTPNYYTICNYWDNYYSLNPQDDYEDGDFMRYIRWKKFWQNRSSFGGGDEDKKGNINYANQLYREKINSPDETICIENTELTQIWEPLGAPISMQTSNQGLIPAIHVDYDENGDVDIVYVGSRASGIFKTENPMDATPEWVCITDVKKLPSIGAQSIVVSEDNQNIVAASWTEMGGWTNFYAMGVIYSLDGGDNWDFSDFDDDADEYGGSSHSKILKLIKHPDDEDVIYAISRWRLYRSDDKGATFNHICFNPGTDADTWTQYDFSDIEVDSRTDESHKNKIYISGVRRIGVFETPVIYMFNVTSNSFISTLPNNLAENLTEFDNSFKYIFIDHSGGNIAAFYLNDCNGSSNERRNLVDWSDDEGETFTNLYTDFVTGCNLEPLFYPSVFEISPALNTIYVETGKTPYYGNVRRALTKIQNDGAGNYDVSNCNWAYTPTLTNNNHADIRAISVIEFTEDGELDKIFVCHDGGISYTETGSGTPYVYEWVDKNGIGLNNSEFFNVSTISDAKLRSHYSAQDNGHIDFNNGIPDEFECVDNGVDGYEQLYNQDDLNNFNRCGNASISPYHPPCDLISNQWVGNDCPEIFNPARMSVDIENNLYIGRHELYRFDFNTAGGTQTPDELSNFPEGTIQAIHAAKNDLDYIYVSMEGETWSADMSNKFFVCTTATATPPLTWIDIGGNLFEPCTTLTELEEIDNYALAGHTIWDIVTDPDDGTKVWISFGNIDPEGHVRVYKSEDAGQNWCEYSDGLPIFPVSRLVYQEGSNDLIYAATDVGVYYRDASMSSWECFSNDLPICVVSDIEIDYCEGKLYASTFGRGAWTTDLIQDYTDEIEISGEVNWSDSKRIYHHTVRVLDDAKLTISDIVRMPKDSRIIVEEGGMLVLDGGTLTNSCDEVWEGVEVWGIPGNAQGTVNVTTPSSSNTTQGLLIMKNGALIENAKWGVMLADGEGSVTKTGGIIVAENSTFRNNRKDVAFMQYKPYSISNFVNCTFLTDQPMNGTEYNGEGSNGHVTIWGMRGVDFTDCDFVCDLDDSWDSNGEFYDFNPDKRGLGIASVNALYSVNSTDSEDDDNRSRFLNLTRGVWTGKTYSSEVRWTHIDGALFDNCLYGTEIDGSTQDRVTDCDYNVPQPDFLNYGGKAWGIYTVSCKNFKLEENTFTDIGVSPSYNMGIINQGYKLNGIAGGLVRGNIHNGTFIGNQMERNNPYLKVNCNEYTDHAASWAVNPEVQNQILGPQGTGCALTDIRADNLFIDQSDDIWSWAQFWSYWAADAADAVPDFATSSINGTLGITGEPCFDRTTINCVATGGNFGDEKSLKAELDEKYADLEDEYTDVEGDLDNGQKSTMLTHIATAAYPNSTLTTELIANSPLSDEVLTAALNRTSFSSQQKIDFTVPNCPVSAEVWIEVDDAFAGPIPEDITDAQVESTVRTLTAIKREGEGVISDLFLTLNNIFKLYAEADSIDGLIYYMKDTLDYKEAHKLLVGTLLEVDSIELARTVLEGIDLEDVEEEAFYDFYDIAVTLAENEDSWFDINGIQRTIIEDLAESDYEVAINAQAVLWLVDGEVFPRTPEVIPDSAGKWDGEEPQLNQQPTPDETNNLKNISVYPNPFNNSFNVNYILEQEANEVRVEIFDLVGRTVFTKKMGKTARGNIKIDLGECLGVYVLRVYADDRQVHKEKLICLQR